MNKYTSKDIQNIQYVIDQEIIDYIEGKRTLHQISDTVDTVCGFGDTNLLQILPSEYVAKFDQIEYGYQESQQEYYDPKNSHSIESMLQRWYNQLITEKRVPPQSSYKMIRKVRENTKESSTAPAS